MEKPTIPDKDQKEIAHIFRKLTQFADAVAKILPVLFALTLIPGFLTLILYGMRLRCPLIQDLPSASCIALMAFACAGLLAILLIFPVLLPTFAFSRDYEVRKPGFLLRSSLAISGLSGYLCGSAISSKPLLSPSWSLIILLILIFGGHACVVLPAQGASRSKHLFSLFVSCFGSFLALCSLFITTALSTRSAVLVGTVMFTAVLGDLIFLYRVVRDKMSWTHAFFVSIGILCSISVVLLINPDTTRFVLSSIGLRGPGPVSILVEGKTAGAFSSIPGVTTEQRGECFFIKNVGIAFRSGSQTIVEAPYVGSEVPPKGSQLVAIQSDDVRAVSQDAQPIRQ